MEQDQQYSDDEIYTGPITLTEMKKRLGMNYSNTVDYWNPHNSQEDGNRSLKIIETHSTPDIIASCNEQVKADKPVSSPNLPRSVFNIDWELRADDSFLQLEKLVSDLNISPNANGNDRDVLDDTEEVVEFILNNRPSENMINFTETAEINLSLITNNPNVEENETPIKVAQNLNDKSSSSVYSTPAKELCNVKQELFATPTPGLQRTPIFKTPANPASQRKLPGSQRKKAFDHIVSPIACYIKNSPSVPLVTDVKPKKPFIGVSCIPQPLKSANKPNMANKENVKLPSVAYKNAKETKVIELPEKSKLPQSVWAKQVASSIPRAVVRRHEYREGSAKKKVLAEGQQENSFADLSLHQAELSVCTQQSAVKMPQHKVMK